MKRITVFFFCLFLIPAILLGSDFFEIKKVSKSVYAAIGKPGVLSNGAFIVTDEFVIVIDTHMRPSWARDLIKEIRKVSDKPVRYVINTHWHNDHTQGNWAYQIAFPGNVEFVSHHNTRSDILSKAIPSLKQNVIDLPRRIRSLEDQLSSEKSPDGTDLTPSRKEQLERQADNLKAYLEELKNLEITLPNLSFEKSMSIHSGNTRIDLLYFGEGHTRGDIFIFLAEEKILISGDMLTGGVPFMRDAIPTKWGPTLKEVSKLDFDIVIPGHGDVQYSKSQMNLVIRYLHDLVEAVSKHVQMGLSLEETTVAVQKDLAQYEKHFSNFYTSLIGPTGNIAKTYGELSAKK